MLKKMWQKDKRKVKKLVEGQSFDKFIMALICMDAVILGISAARLMPYYAVELFFLDRLFMAIFIIEMIMKLYAYGTKFFKNGWNTFDLVVIGVSSFSMFSYLIILRVFRLFRVLKYMKKFGRLKDIINTFIMFAPNFLAMLLIFGVFFYVFAIMAVSLYGETFAGFFGSLGTSLFTLLQIMTLDGWANIARPVMMVYPLSWIFFVAFIFVSFLVTVSFLMNLIGEIVEMNADKKCRVKDRL